MKLEEFEREEVPFLENNLIFHAEELQTFKEEDEEEFLEEMWVDEEPLHNAIAVVVEHSTIYRSPLIMVSPRRLFLTLV